MAPRLLLFSSALVIIAAAGVAGWANGRRVRESQAQVVPPKSFTAESLVKINEVRAKEEKSALGSDPALEAWLAQRLTNVTPESVSKLQADDLLADMGAELPGVKSVAAGVFFATRNDELLAEALQWRESLVAERTHLAAALLPVAFHKDTQAGVMVVATRVPEFAPELLGTGVVDFHHRCPLCGHQYLGRFLGDQITLAVRCPKCQEVHDLVAYGSDGKFRHFNEYFSQLQWPAKFPSGVSRMDEMLLVWRAVVERCSYAADDSVAQKANADSWQSSRQTFESRRGDCEDLSILLADWLIGRGFDARVVVGESRSLAGHAWCVVRLDGQEYLLETTDPNRANGQAPKAEELAADYLPEFQFNRDNLYVLKSKGIRTCAYWSDLIWTQVARPSAKSTATGPSALINAWEAPN